MKPDRDLPRLLIHACCAPCSTVPIARLAGRFQLAIYFYGPNIHPQSEYERRLAEQHRLCQQLGVPLIAGEYQPDDWERAIAPVAHLPEGSLRCRACFDLRMRETARRARQDGFDAFTVTLSVSRHKNSRVLAEVGNEVARVEGVEYLAEDFKKQAGEAESIRLSRHHGLYRQDYCGCRLSLAEAAERRRNREKGTT